MVSGIKNCCLAVTFLVAFSGFSRAETATVSGKITDAQGAAVPAATLVAKLKRCSCKDCPDSDKCSCCIDQIRVSANDSGAYRFSAAAGDYEITVTIPGFKTARQDITLGPDQSMRVDIKVQ
jgi:hypothetical protein